MFKKSLIYQNSFFYFLGLKLFHKCDSPKRDKYIASLVKKGETVLEPACGPANLANSLPTGINYIGFDLNESFISYAKKRRLNVYLGNVLKKNSYQKADVVIVCDTLHHIKLRDRKEFIENSYFHAKRLFIFCDCVKETRGLLRKIMRPLNGRLFEFLDKDGVNEPKYDEMYNEEQLKKQIEDGFGTISKNTRRKVRRFGCDMLAIFYK